jgi:hypothetical protein
VSYMIRPNPFSTPARTAWSLIFATVYFNQAQRTCQRHKKTFTLGHTHCSPPISVCAQSVMNALGIQSSCTDAILFASALIHGSRSGYLELEVIMYATGTPFSQSSETIDQGVQRKLQQYLKKNNLRIWGKPCKLQTTGL